MLARSAYVSTGKVLDSFARRVTETRLVWTVSGEDGLARMASPTRLGREVTLAWSTQAEAERWSRMMARHPRVNPIVLGNFITQVLPKLRNLNRLVMPDWSADIGHPQFEPAEIEQRLKIEGVSRFAEDVQGRGAVYILEDEMGPAFAASARSAAKLVLPCWTTRDGAEQQVRGFWSEMMISEIAVATFVAKTLPWIAGLGRAVSLNHGQGGATIEIGALELAGKLARKPQLRRTA